MDTINKIDAVALMVVFTSFSKIQQIIEYRGHASWEDVGERLRNKVQAGCQDKTSINPFETFVKEQGFKQWCAYYMTQKDIDDLSKGVHTTNSSRSSIGVPGADEDYDAYYSDD